MSTYEDNDLKIQAKGVQRGAGSTTIVVDGTLAGKGDNFYKGAIFIVVSGNNAGRFSRVETYTSVTGTFFLYPAFPVNVETGDRFSVKGEHAAIIAEIHQHDEEIWVPTDLSAPFAVDSGVTNVWGNWVQILAAVGVTDIIDFHKFIVHSCSKDGTFEVEVGVDTGPTPITRTRYRWDSVAAGVPFCPILFKCPKIYPGTSVSVRTKGVFGGGGVANIGMSFGYHIY